MNSPTPCARPSDTELVTWQQLETALARFADTELARITHRISDPDVHHAAAAYLTRASKRLLGMAFLHATHTLNTEGNPHDLIAGAATLEIRHGAIAGAAGTTTRGYRHATRRDEGCPPTWRTPLLSAPTRRGSPEKLPQFIGV